MDIDDETLMALADGEIAGDAAARLHPRIAEDPALAARHALFVETGRLAARAMPEVPVSDDLVARVRAMGATAAPEGDSPAPEARGTVVAFRRRLAGWQPAAIAAGLALAVGVAAGLLISDGPGAPDTGLLTAGVRGALDSVSAGEGRTLPDGRQMTVVASFTDADGAFCREYETAAPGAGGHVAVACREGSGWDLRFAMAQGGGSGGYAPASALAALDAFYAATGAGAPMSVEEERERLDVAR